MFWGFHILSKIEIRNIVGFKTRKRYVYGKSWCFVTLSGSIFYPAAQVKDWRVSPDLYPTQASEEAEALVEAAVKSAEGAWGQRQLPELQAEDLLAFACEKAPTDDQVNISVHSLPSGRDAISATLDNWVEGAGQRLHLRRQAY